MTNIMPPVLEWLIFRAMENEESSTRVLGRTLIDAFGKGWSKADPELMIGIFSSEAVFIETPFSEPLKGADAIVSFCRETVFYQADITFTSGEIYAAGSWFSTEFKLDFQRRRTGEWVEARGAIFCETDGSKITEMRMYWHRWNSGRETSNP